MARNDISNLKYVPILKAKLGEFGALRDSADDVAAGMIPMFEIPPVSKDYENDVPKKTTEAHIETTLVAMKRNLKDDVFYLDFVDQIISDSALAGNPYSVISEESMKELQIIPVVTVDRDASFLDAAAGIAHRVGKGMALRVHYDASNGGDESIEIDKGQIDNLLARIKLSPEDIDVCLDLGSVYQNNGKFLALASRLLLAEFPYLDKWRHVILSGSSFPPSAGGLEKSTMTKLERTEWQVWNKLYEKRDRIKRLPIYSDYSVAHPAVVDFFDPRYMVPTASIRYTLPEVWLIVNGVGLKQSGTYSYGQFRDLSKSLVATSDFFGEDYSAGDKFIHECASNPEATTGNLTSWRKVGNIHHFKLVHEQLASLSD